jgi:hypothetical protein
MDSLTCAQINTHHCKAAMVDLSLIGNNVRIFLIQEPYCHNGEPCYILSDCSAFFVPSNKNPRASLLIKRGIARNFLFLHQFSDPDNIIVVHI